MERKLHRIESERTGDISSDFIYILLHRELTLHQCEHTILNGILYFAVHCVCEYCIWQGLFQYILFLRICAATFQWLHPIETDPLFNFHDNPVVLSEQPLTISSFKRALTFACMQRLHSLSPMPWFTPILNISYDAVFAFCFCSVLFVFSSTFYLPPRVATLFLSLTHDLSQRSVTECSIFNVVSFFGCFCFVCHLFFLWPVLPCVCELLFSFVSLSTAVYVFYVYALWCVLEIHSIGRDFLYFTILPIFSALYFSKTGFSWCTTRDCSCLHTTAGDWSPSEWYWVALFSWSFSFTTTLLKIVLCFVCLPPPVPFCGKKHEIMMQTCLCLLLR